MADGNRPVDEVVAEALRTGDPRRAATEAIRGYGPEILGYLTALLRDQDAAWEVFSAFSERLWRGIDRFRGEASIKTWAYKIAWNAAQSFLDKARRKQERPFLSGELSQIAEGVRATFRSSTSSFRELDDLVSRVRRELAPDEQTLLILRIDRDLSWKEVAAIMAEEGEPVDPATLRKRYERLRQRILKRVAEERAAR
jgi:RNA polymerase sigma-70 factor (ECF subfamily)